MNDVVLIEPMVITDERGFFLESYQKQRFSEAGIPFDFVQDNHSKSVRGVLRGLHYQIKQPQGKLVRVISGEIFDVAVDIRKNSSTFGKLDFAEKANQSGIMVIHLPTGSIAGKITYLSSLDEIYDVQILADKLRPNILNTITPDYKSGLMTPKATFWAKPVE